MSASCSTSASKSPITHPKCQSPGELCRSEKPSSKKSSPEQLSKTDEADSSSNILPETRHLCQLACPINSTKQFYGQPLHYLTHILVKRWDQLRIGTVDAEKPIGSIIHPRRAESTIRDVEEVHRRCTSHTHLANLWLSDPEYHAFVDDVVPSSKSVA